MLILDDDCDGLPIYSLIEMEALSRPRHIKRGKKIVNQNTCNDTLSDEMKVNVCRDIVFNGVTYISIDIHVKMRVTILVPAKAITIIG